jgi:hypothetical protein
MPSYNAVTMPSGTGAFLIYTQRNNLIHLFINLKSIIMKKKVFSLMMTLLLAFIGVAKADVVTIGEGTSTTYYGPFNSLWGYSFVEQIYTADEIGTAGTITSISFNMSSTSEETNSVDVFMKNVSRTQFSDNTDWEPVTASDMVFSGTVTFSPGWTTITLDTPFEYDGFSNLMIGMHEYTPGYSTRYFYYTSATNALISAHSDTADPNPYDIGSFTGTKYVQNYRVNLQMDIIPGGGASLGDRLHVKYLAGEEEIVDSLNLGTRPIGAWMEPFNFIMYSEGPTYTVNVLDFTPNEDLFVVEGVEFPFQVRHNQDVDLTMFTNGTQAGLIERQFVAITEGDRAAHVWPVVVELYAPEVPDVWEMACEEATTFPFVEVPATAHNTILHNDYTLPFPEIPEGYDAVYKLVFDHDQILDASVTAGENGKVALYTEDFYGENGPMAHNNYTGIQMGGGGSGAAFEAMIGDETSTSSLTYFPFHTLWNYSLAENLFLASELNEAGVTSAPMTSLSWYVSSTTCTTPQSGISIWMGNVSDEALTGTSHTTAGMTLVYTGSGILPVAGEWNEFVFNEGTFSWDGHSNVLILCQRQNGSWQGSVSWQTHNPGFAATCYAYTDTAPGYDATTQTYSMSTSTTNRANIIMKSNGGRAVNRDVTVNFEDQQIPAEWNNDATYPWVVVNENGSYVMKSSNGGNASTTSTISATYDLNNTGSISFDALCMGEGTSTIWDKCIFSIDGVQQFSYGANVAGWNNYSYDLNPGTHTFTWSYSKDSSVNPTGDYFMVDNVTVTGMGDPLPEPEITYSFGPVIEDLPLRGGTYYLVASSTDPDFEVTINAEDMPCPEVDGFAFNPTPVDNAEGIEPGSVTLRWNIPSNTTGWRLIFGTTYHPEPGHPQTIMFPEDGSFTTALANSYTVRNLWNNTNYFWRVEFTNDGCPEGVSSPVWGFTTHLNIPQNLTAVDYTVFDDETVVLNWNAVVDRTYRQYNVYRNGELIGNTQVNNIGNTTYTDGPLAYNMEGYTYYVTAVYDEGESAPSDPVTVKVSGYGNVDGHVFEQDGTTGIAGATVTMVGMDEFNVSHTYNFTTNAQGYYSGHIYAGNYNGSAAKDGYQTIYEPVQGNPIAMVYNQTTSPVDYILDENFDPVCSVLAEYYPDPEDINAPYVKVSWGCGLPGEEIIEPFETGDFSLFDWQIDANYPWSITTTNPYEGTYCMKSGGAGVASVVSNMSVTVNIPADGLMSFFGKISCENNWDYGYFYIDGVQMASFTGAGSWIEKTYDVTAGDHNFMWQYTKDASVNSNDDCFYVDYIHFYKQPAPPTPPVPGMTYDFEDHSMQGWTSVDADGDGRGWMVGSELMSGVNGHNSSSDFVFSQSYDNSWGVLYPDNYLVSPQVQLGGIVRFYACAQDANYAAEHFGVAVSTTNTNPSSFTMVQEWTMSAKSVGEPGKPVRNSRSGREQGNWYEYTVDLSAYSGNGYVAIRHFNCSDMFYLDVDDITIGEPGKGIADNTRSLSHYRIYRTNCYNDGPYTEENTVLLATNWPGDTIYIDISWPDAAPGVYKWGVGTVYEGNRGEMVEGPISWTAPVAVNRSAAADNDPNPVSGEDNGVRAPWDLMATFQAPEAAHYGVVTDGNYIYTSNWGYASAAHNFYKYDMQGNMIEGFEIPGCGTLRGMTFDGQYVYGVANSSTVYCVDLNNHTLVSTFTSAYGAQRGIAYDSERDGFWVIGNWSGNLALINRSGAIVTTGPTPSSVSDLAYYKDENNVEHVFCFNNSDNGVYDYNITTNTLGGSVFNFSAVPGFNAGTSGGCHVGEYNGMMAFFGDLQQDPNLIGIYELRNGGGVGPTPGPGGENLNQLALPRESETIWSNCLDKDMWLDAVDVTVLLNSADSPEGVMVALTNLNEYEQAAYPVDPVTLDETGFYAWDHFRKGEYSVKVEFDGYEPIDDTVSIWDETHLRYVMTEILYGVGNVYVSRTGWAMWDEANIPGGGGGGQGGNGDTFSYDFDNGMPSDWTTLDADGDGLTWVSSMTPGIYHNSGVDLTGTGHNSSAHYVISGSYANQTGQVLYPDNYLVSPRVNIAAGSTFSFWACAQDANYAAEHYGVSVSDNGTDWTLVQEWTMTAKDGGNTMSAGRDGNNRAQGNWYQKTVDLSAYAGQKYIAIRHFNCYDQFILNVDDVELTAGAKDGGDRHFEYYKVLCTSIDGVPIYNHNTVHPFCQLTTDGPYNAPLVEGEHYLCKVAAMYSTGMSAWSEPVEWEYEPCDHWGPVDEVSVDATTQGNHIQWVFEHGYNPYGGDTPGPGPGEGDAFSVDFEGGLPAGWTVIDGNNDGWTWCLTSAIPTTWTYYASLTLDWYHSGTNAICSGSYINGVGALNPDEYLVSPQVNLAAGSQLSFWVAATDASYAADHFGVFVSDDMSNWTSVQEWTLTGKKNGMMGGAASRNGEGLRLGTWYNYSVDLSAYAGQKYIAFRHFNCYDQYIMCLDDIELTSGAKSYSTTESGMMGSVYAVNITDIDNFDERVIFLHNLINDARFDVVNGEAAGMFIVSAAQGYEDLDLELAVKEFTYNNANQFSMMDKVQAASMARAYKAEMPASFTNSMMMDIFAKSRDNAHCADAYPFCTDEGMYEFPAGVNAGSGETGPDYDCLYTTPNPAWYYMKISDPGDMDIYMYSTPSVDIDFCCWGPFADPISPCPNGLTSDKVVSCSYSAAPTENCLIPSTAQTGEYYILIITNYSNQACNINFSKVSGSGSTDCSIVVPTVDLIGFLITQDGEYLAFAGPDDREYTDIDEFGDHEYCVRPIYPGEMTLPDHNYGWSMGCPVCEFGPNGQGTCEPGAPIYGEALNETDQVKIWWGEQNPGPGGCEGDEFTVNFESGIPAGWTTIDADGDGYNWNLASTTMGTGYGHNGSSDMVFSQSYDNNFGALTPDNYLVTPAVTLCEGSTFSFYACAQDASWAAEHFGVAISDDGVNFGMVQEWTMTSKGQPYSGPRGMRDQGNWYQYTVDLGDYAGEGRYIAIRHFNCTDMFYIDVDDIQLTAGAKSRANIVKYNVYRSDDNANYTLIGEVAAVAGQTYYEYIDTPATAGTYYYQVRADYGDCESEPAVSGVNPAVNYVSVQTTGVDENSDKVALFPNPTNGNVTIQANGMSRITVVSVLGQVVYDTELNADEFTLNMGQFNAGLYMVRVYTENGVTVKRVTVMQ